MDCPIKTPVEPVESNGSIIDAEGDMVLKVLYSHKTFDLQVKQLNYTAKAINSNEKLLTVVKNLVSCATKYPKEGATIRLNETIPYVIKQAIEALKEAEKQ